MNESIKEMLIKTYKDISFYMEKIEFREVTNVIINLLDRVNKYYDEETPWISFKENINKFNDTIFTCSTAILNIANYIDPIMPDTAKRIRNYLKINESNWKYIEALFNRL